MKRWSFALCALLLAAGTLQARAQQGFTVAVPELARPPSMNGTIDDSWSKAAQLPVNFDFTYQRDGEPTTAYVAQDPGGIDVAFVVTQKQALTANTQTNGGGVTSDDNVSVTFWPQGSGGFYYSFSANSLGARYQTSSENSAYAPDWTAVAKRTPQGYTVTMRIPFDIMRTGGSNTWGVQFERVIQATNSAQVWEHVEGQRNAADRSFEGTLTGLAAHGGSKTRPQPRLQIYGLGELTTKANGGNTSRVGADLSIPVTGTSSFVASLHPDYSNVETDQQTISPNAFARFYSEVRPFFTQLTAFNDQFSCNNCPTLLYTPSIPTFREGYAYEGTEGDFQYDAFDSIGDGRTDDAEVVDYAQQDSQKVLGLSLQRVGVNVSNTLHDDTTSLFTGYEWQKSHDFVYLNTASDRGTFVSAPGLGNYLEYGVGHVDKNAVYGVSYQKIGAQFRPVDGFVAQPDVQGLQVFFKETFYFSKTGTLQDVQANAFFNDQNDHLGNPAFKDGNAQLNFDFKHELTLHVFAGDAKNQTFWREYLPFNQNGVYLGYKTQTTTPSSIMFMNGSYFHGSLSSWSYITTLPVTHALHLALEADENTYTPLGAYGSIEPFTRQWLERASIDWQFNRYASFDVGARRIMGPNLPNAYQQPFTGPCATPIAYCPFDPVNAGNVSAAFHFLAAHNEWYVVYGNPNFLTTQPAFYVKWVRYIGAEKGT